MIVASAQFSVCRHRSGLASPCKSMALSGVSLLLSPSPLLLHQCLGVLNSPSRSSPGVSQENILLEKVICLRGLEAKEKQTHARQYINLASQGNRLRSHQIVYYLAI